MACGTDRSLRKMWIWLIVGCCFMESKLIYADVEEKGKPLIFSGKFRASQFPVEPATARLRTYRVVFLVGNPRLCAPWLWTI